MNEMASRNQTCNSERLGATPISRRLVQPTKVHGTPQSRAEKDPLCVDREGLRDNQGGKGRRLSSVYSTPPFAG